MILVNATIPPIRLCNSLIVQRLEFKDSLDFYGISINASLTYHQAKEFPRGNAKGHFSRFKCILNLWNVKSNTQITDVVLEHNRFSDHVIHMNLHCFFYWRFKHVVNQPLIRCINIFQTKWHNLVVYALISYNGSTLFIIIFHSYLIILGESIHKVHNAWLVVVSTSWSTLGGEKQFFRQG